MDKKIDKGTIVRTIIEVLAIVNQIVAIIGRTTFASSSIYQYITLGLTIITSIICYWYNNDWTKFALLTRDIFGMLEDGKIEEDEVEKFIEEHKE